MFRVITILFFTIFYVEAKTMVADYVVEFGVVGQVGKVHSLYKDDSKYYIIDTNLSAVGTLARTVTHNLKEQHICKGYLDKGLHVVTSYEMIKSYGVYKSTTLYEVDHTRKKVTKHYRLWKKNKKTDRYKKEVDNKIELGYYAKSDMVTLFLNLGVFIDNKTKAKNYRFKAVGADRKNGRVDIRIPSKKEARVMKNLVGNPKKGEWLMNLIMHRKLYSSKQGELMVRMGKNNIMQKAVLKDILFFGDVRIIKQ
jgi:hypothetical protein